MGKRYLVIPLIASLAVMLLAGTMVMVQADSPKRDAKKDTSVAGLKDFDLKRYGFKKNGDAYVAVYGQAGQTLPVGEHTAYAYVIHTNNGIYASDSHEAQHADNEEVANKSWHGHKIEFNDQGCIDEIGAFKSEAVIKNHRVIIKETGATQIFKAQTVELEILVDDPDNPPAGATCIVKVKQVFDEAVLSLDNIEDDNARED
ncbi:MAG: hypothetical protein ACREAY_09815 [Nitrososphaera sp.]|uniref:hypothetical protein n=1 Tax=Nitrososphaera sp. TaxID=1971748 RepID=UPI003D6EA22A